MLIENYRRESSCRRLPLDSKDFMSSRKTTIGQACVAALQFELGYGGRYNDELSGDDRIVITTGILSSTDDTVFTGTKDEIQTLLGVVCAYLTVSQSARANEQAVKLSVKLSQSERGPNLGIILHGVPILVGQGVARLAIIGYMAKTRDQVERLGKVETKSLYTLFEWYIDGAPLKEIMEIAA